MKNFVLFFILSIFLLNSISAQTHVKNWENVLWNSTTEQIKIKFQDKLIKLDKRENYDGSYCDYILENYQAFNSNFSVHFLMDDNNSLNSIQLKYKIIKSDAKTDVNDANKLYEAILENMNDEYGEPDNSELSKYSTSSTWHFKTTIVSLAFMHIDSDFLKIFINYQKASQGFDFREVKWGFTKKQVKANEKLIPIIDKEDIIGYESSIAGIKCLIGYVFINDKLIRAKYVMQEPHTNKLYYINDYNNLKNLLIKKYGDTILENDINWYNNLYKNDFQQWGFAISLGHLSFNSSWRTPKTEIGLVLSGDNYEISLVIEYTSEQFEGIEDKIKEKEIIKKL